MILAVSAAARAIFFGLAVVCFVLAAPFVRGKLTQIVWIALGLALTVFVFFLEAADGL